mgnify:CR=1 FL=1|tara:strand:- start:200 stop:1000 length:801 start_codon:yes stop_codon:yes gene_type:complete
MNKVIVFGNGESRSWYKPCHQQIMSDDVTTWGCNAIYRDGDVDNLVAIDYGMQQEIYNSEYQDSHTCWFSDWSIIPSEIAEMTLMGFEGPAFIHRSKNKTSNCVVQGKDPAFIQEKIDSLKKINANLDIDDIEKKLTKDIGIWITYVGDNDPINNIDFPRGWAAGTTALYLACQQGAKEIYMLGFDLSSQNELLNNIYKGTSYYLPADAKGFNPQNWINQLLAVFREFKDTQFYWVDPKHNIGSSTENIDIRYLTKTELCDRLQII